MRILAVLKAENRRLGFGFGFKGRDFGERSARTVKNVISPVNTEMGFRQVVVNT